MATYTDYDFYVNTYKGSAIALADFARMAMRASAVIDQVTYNRAGPVITADDDEATIEKIELATCAVADELLTQEESGGVVQSESIGRHSVTYASPQSNQKRLESAARTHLWSTDLMYRGINEDE
jgi:hypothetical protein